MSFVDPKCVEVNIEGSNKENLFRTATDRLSIHYPDISPIVINSALWEREQLQNTSVGEGVAIPHATLTQAGVADSAIAPIRAETRLRARGFIGEEWVTMGQ